ncbi:MAG: DNA-directed RNA polymerase subunit D [Euryarchaeota archaeon]|nr:DNA-directed RNA polymerase subunit D [Euryarchaeota archaeon]
MELNILELKDRFVRFEIKGITPAMANALRRTLINDIPKLAIHKVIFHHGQIRDSEDNVYDSSTPLFDEIIAHRLGLIPLPTDLNMKFRDECEHPPDEGCPLCTVTYTLNKHGPAVVYSGDLIAVGGEKFRPVDQVIPIVKLKETQAILLEAEAIMGTAKQHAKWQVTSGVTYKYHREIVVNKDFSEYWEEVKEACPQCVIYEDKDKIIFTDDKECKALAKILSYDEHEIKEDDSWFIFQFETDGSLSAKDTLDYALNRLRERFKVLRESAALSTK